MIHYFLPPKIPSQKTGFTSENMESNRKGNNIFKSRKIHANYKSHIHRDERLFRNKGEIKIFSEVGKTKRMCD